MKHKKPTKSIIKKGTLIEVDKGILGTDTGIFISTNGYSFGGFWGLYLSDKGRKEHIWDQHVHKITTMKLLPTNPLVQRMEDMQIPGMKKKVKRSRYVADSELASLSLEKLEKMYPEAKSPHTRGYLRSISDPHHERHLFIKLVFWVAFIYCVIVIL